MEATIGSGERILPPVLELSTLAACLVLDVAPGPSHTGTALRLDLTDGSSELALAVEP